MNTKILITIIMLFITSAFTIADPINSTINSSVEPDSPLDYLIDCTLTIDDRSIGIDEGANVGIDCEGSIPPVISQTILDYQGPCYSSFPGGSGNCNGNECWSRPTEINPIAEWFYENSYSTCEDDWEHSYSARDICIGAVVSGEWWWTECTPGSTDNYITLEVPKLATDEQFFVPNEDFTVKISANAYHDIKEIQFDYGCQLDPAEQHCIDSNFVADGTLYPAGLPNSHQFEDFEFDMAILSYHECVSQGYCGVSMRVVDNQDNYRFHEGFIISLESVVDCTLTINKYPVAQGDNAQLDIACDGGVFPIESIDTYLDYHYSGYPATCQFTKTTQCGGSTTCDVQYTLPEIFETDIYSPCYNYPENAYAPRDVCTKARVNMADSSSFWVFGDCDVGWGTDYITCETPKILTNELSIPPGEPLQVFLYANAYYDISRLEIDLDCEREGGWDCIDDESAFDPDIVINGDAFPNSHHIENGEYEITFTDQACISQEECGVSMRAYDIDGDDETYRFAKGFIISVRDNPSCTAAGGVECCGEHPDWGCTAGAIGGSSCGTVCCAEACLPSCDHQGGGPCGSDQICEGGNFVDSYDYGEGNDARCCLGGQCITSQNPCSSYPNNICCEGSAVCVGGGTPVVGADSCGDGMCYENCISQTCEEEPLVCSNNNQYLSTCDITNQGAKECGSPDILCLCENEEWIISQHCEDGCAGERAPLMKHVLAENPYNGDARNMDICIFPESLGSCLESDYGKNTKEKSVCLDADSLDEDSCHDHDTVNEFYCDNKRECKSTRIDCPDNGVCVDGRCVAGDSDCPAQQPYQEKGDVLCSFLIDSNDQINYQESINSPDLIRICSPEILDFIRDHALLDNQIGIDLLNGLSDRAMNNLYLGALDVITHAPQSSSTLKCNANNPSSDVNAERLIQGNDYGICFEWSSVILSLARTAGVPYDRAYMATYKFIPEGGLMPGTSMPAHTVAMYKTDTGPDWKVIDLTWTRDMFDTTEWESKDSRCNGCRAFYQNDMDTYEWTDPAMFNDGCSNSPFCTDICHDGTPIDSCSAVQPYYCDASGELYLSGAGLPHNCGCPDIPNVYEYSIGSGHSLCYCTTKDQCLPNIDNIPYYCTDEELMLGKYKIAVDCSKGCDCPAGTYCRENSNGWCKVIP